MPQSLESLVARLEVAVRRLEDNTARNDRSSGSGDSTEAAAVSASVQAFDELISGSLNEYLDAAKRLGGEVVEQAAHVEAAFKAQRSFLLCVGRCKKPSIADFQEALKPTSEHMMAAQNVADRQGKFKNHLRFIGEGIGALGWVTVAPTPAPFVGEMLNAALFYGNKILVETNRAEEHVAFFQKFKQLLGNLSEYVKEYHRTGIQWNPSGEDLKHAQQGATAQGPPPAAPVPPPPPVLENTTSSSSSKAPNVNALFAELNKGDAITQGLKKVTADMKSKNRADRSGHVTDQPKRETSARTEGAPKAAAVKPPRLTKEGNKWYIEHHVDNQGLEIESESMKDAVYVFNCTGKASRTVAQLKGKLNTVTIDSCSKTSIVVDEVIGSIELVNCKSVELQVSVAVPIINVDKSSACTIYLLGDSAKNAEIITSKNDSLNIVTPGKTEDDDFTETPVPEQYATRLLNGKWITVPVEHSSG